MIWDLPAGWKWEKIGKYVDERDEIIGSLDEGTASQYQRLRGVTNREGITDPPFDQARTLKDPDRYVVLKVGYFAYNPMRINVGSIGLVRTEEDMGKISPDYVVFSARPSLHPEYLFAYLKSEIGLAVIRHIATGAIRRRLYFRDLAALPIPIPKEGEQDRIVGIIQRADAISRLHLAAEVRTGDLISAYFYEMFGDPITNPMKWPVVKAGSLMEACGYGTSKKPDGDSSGTPILRMSNVNYDGSIDISDLKYVKLGVADHERHLLQTGDVLFNRTNSRELVGKTGVWDGRVEGVPASYFIRIRFKKEEEDPQHFSGFMNLPYMKMRLKKLARGAIGQANINSKELKAITLPKPPIKLQREFAERALEVRSLQYRQFEGRLQYRQLFQSVLYNAFRGQL